MSINKTEDYLFAQEFIHYLGDQDYYTSYKCSLPSALEKRIHNLYASAGVFSKKILEDENYRFRGRYSCLVPGCSFS